MPSLLVRLLTVLLERLEATNSQQLYSHVGMLEAVKSERTLRNVGYRIFFSNSFVSGTGKQVLLN